MKGTSRPRSHSLQQRTMRTSVGGLCPNARIRPGKRASRGPSPARASYRYTAGACGVSVVAAALPSGRSAAVSDGLALGGAAREPRVALPAADWRFPREVRERTSGASHSWDDLAVGDRAVHTTEPYPAQLAVENERLQRALRARLKEEQALRRVATLVAREHAPGAVLARVTEEVGAPPEARRGGDRALRRPAARLSWRLERARDPARFTVGTQMESVPQLALARAFETVAPARVDSYEGCRGALPARSASAAYEPAVAAPILVDGQLWGAFAAGSTPTRSAEARDAPRRVRRTGRAGDRQRRCADQAQGSRARASSKPPTTLAGGSSAISTTAPSSVSSPLRCRCGSRARRLSRPPRRRSRAASRTCAAALAELRELARGLHPAVLTRARACRRRSRRSPRGLRCRSCSTRPRRAAACRPRDGAVLRRRRGADQRRQVRPGERRRGDAARRRPLGRDHRHRRRRGRRARRARLRAARPLETESRRSAAA